MGHQFSFYLTPVDTISLEQRVSKKDRFLVLHSRSQSSQPRIIDSLVFTEKDQPWLFTYLVLPEELDYVVMRHVPEQAYWSVDSLRSPVIEFNNSFRNDSVFRPGRAYYVDRFYGDDASLIKKSPRFCEWSKYTLSAMKKTLNKKDNYYYGAEATIIYEQNILTYGLTYR